MEGWHRLRPTREQYRAFGEYLAHAHSWYKHLPLLHGRRFVVFAAPDAGTGRLVGVPHGSDAKTATEFTFVTPPDGSEFTDENPRLHYGWKTTREYRSRFGYLDYSCWPAEDGGHARDAGPPVRLSAEVEERCGFVLYPYVSEMFTEAVKWSVHQEAMRRLRAGAAHPAREWVLALADLVEADEAAWSALSDEERKLLLNREAESEQSLPGGVSAQLLRRPTRGKGIRAIMDALRAEEAEKIRRALAALDEWLRCEA